MSAGRIRAGDACPCGSSGAYGRCCRPLHLGEPAPTPERLLRSRYSAYALGLEGYLLASWHPLTRPAEVGGGPRWLGLTIVRALGETVEFRARWGAGKRRGELHEVSRFGQVDGRWLYLDGEVR